MRRSIGGLLRMNCMDEKIIKAIEKAVSDGFRVEVLKDKDGNIIAQTIQRKRLKLDIAPTA